MTKKLCSISATFIRKLREELGPVQLDWHCGSTWDIEKLNSQRYEVLTISTFSEQFAYAIVHVLAWPALEGLKRLGEDDDGVEQAGQAWVQKCMNGEILIKEINGLEQCGREWHLHPNESTSLHVFPGWCYSAMSWRLSMSHSKAISPTHVGRKVECVSGQNLPLA